MSNGPTKVMIIRHAEKPPESPSLPPPFGVDSNGNQDDKSLIVQGWERAGGLAALFAPGCGVFQNAELATPSAIYASNPDKPGKKHKPPKEASQRPLETISALAAKLKISPIVEFDKDSYQEMVTDVLRNQTGTVLISWQHQDILPDPKGPNPKDSIVTELLSQTKTTALTNIPAGPWPGGRFDMVLVFDRPSGSGAFTSFTQVPQLLLAGDSKEPI